MDEIKLYDDLSHICTDDFWYDIAYGGYIKPEDVTDDEETKEFIKSAVEVLREIEEKTTDW